MRRFLCLVVTVFPAFASAGLTQETLPPGGPYAEAVGALDAYISTHVEQQRLPALLYFVFVPGS